MRRRRLTLVVAALGFVLSITGLPACGQGEEAVGDAPAAPHFEINVSFPSSLLSEPVDGRLLVVLSPSQEPEPRFQVEAGVAAVPIFGVDVEGWGPGGEAMIDGSTFGYPVERLEEVPAGEYWVQVVLHRYETFHRADGHTVKLPMDRGEGQHWNRAPGNLYSTPVRASIDPHSGGRLRLALDQVIAPIPPPEDTPYLKHVRIESRLLSEFWGRPMFLGAHVLLPDGFDEHPEARYPIAIFHGHFPADFGGFRSEPPEADLPCQRSERFGVDCYNRVEQQEAYDFYKRWTSPGFPRLLIAEIQHANPYYDDSYAVNSANLGPYGDAITYELIPYLEKTFRGLGQPWARFLYGGSTGGWEALAAQVFYPGEYNGAFAACPDPVDFRAYTSVNLYEDDNAYLTEGAFRRLERPARRDYLGKVTVSVRDYNHLELVLGTRGRSGDQFDIWEAVYSPVDDDGYPKRTYDKRSGEIDPQVAAYWREHYDLRYILDRDWATLGPQLEGKIHVYCGDMDNYYLNNAVYLLEDFLKGTTEPPYGGEVDYGDRAEHCWNGDHENGNHISRLRYNTFYLPKILQRIEAAAPPGADLTSWRY